MPFLKHLRKQVYFRINRPIKDNLCIVTKYQCISVIDHMLKSSFGLFISPLVF